MVRGGGDQDKEIALLDLESGQHRVIIPGGTFPRYASTGHILYGADRTLRAVPFDLDTLEVTGTPVPLIEELAITPNGAATFAVSLDGSLVYPAGDLVAENEPCCGSIWGGDARNPRAQRLVIFESSVCHRMARGSRYNASTTAPKTCGSWT